MKNLAIVLWDQCSINLSSLRNINKDRDVVLLPEIWEDATYVKHHKKKLLFIYATYRNFVTELKSQGYNLMHLKLDSEKNLTLTEVIERYESDFSKIVITEPSEYRVEKELSELEKRIKDKLLILADDRFYCSKEEFRNWVGDNKSIRMEYFYRKMRIDHAILLNKDKTPIGGKWNYDKSNRNPIKENIEISQRPKFQESKIVKELKKLINDEFKENFGDIDEFDFPVTRKDANEWLEFFITKCLVNFGHYQDAMMVDGHYLFHSVISMLINIGLLSPKYVCKVAEEKYRAGAAPLESVEGFIRQIIGWREFVRGVYFLKMPQYKEMNFFNAKNRLPDFYWTGETKMRCLSNVVMQTKKYAYSHHIQRLMITGNFALLAGLDVEEVCDWYLIVYADAYDWVELPNTLGMALFGDGGFFASKPYAASGNYINKMSNFCKGCYYDVKTNDKENSCPYNTLYWDFMIRNEDKLRNNMRLKYVFSTLDKMTKEKKKCLTQRSEQMLKNLNKI